MSQYTKFDLDAAMHTQEVPPATFATPAIQQEESSGSSESSTPSPIDTYSTTGPQRIPLPRYPAPCWRCKGPSERQGLRYLLCTACQHELNQGE